MLRLKAMLHGIDRQIGRHMSAVKWVVVWTAIAIGGGYLCFQGWWAFLGAPVMFIGALGIHGNARRLR